MTQPDTDILDKHGRAFFTCADCRQPLTSDDLFDLGMRTPDFGETYDDYCADELVDTIRHLRCLRVRAG